MTACTDAAPGSAITLTGTADEGFIALYGIPAVSLGEEGERLMALGHISDRAVRAVTHAYYRRVCGVRVQPCSALADLTQYDTRRIHIRAARSGDDTDCAWEFNETPAGPEAQAVTVIGVEALTFEDMAVQSECPVCDRPSRSTRFTTGPGRSGWGPYHHCRHCRHRWPAVPVLRPSLAKHRRFPIGKPGGCFACHCTPDHPCSPGCVIRTEPLFGQRLCTSCRAQHPADTWEQLAAVAYGTATHSDYHDEQRDRWLYSEALRGTPPTQAARSWPRRLALATRRTAAHQETTTP